MKADIVSEELSNIAAIKNEGKVGIIHLDFIYVLPYIISVREMYKLATHG